jgi:glycosyltransferase involved in cell wall biosynthesis
MIRLLIVNDNTWDQTNGVVTTFQNVVQRFDPDQIQLRYVTPQEFRNVKGWFYPDFTLALNPWKLKHIMQEFSPTHVHIATEGVLGYAAKFICDSWGWKYTTSFHTRWDHYARDTWGFTPWGLTKFIQLFHSRSEKVLVTTASMAHEVSQLGIQNPVVWSRGVDANVFSFGSGGGAVKPVCLSVGRVSVEKNLHAFCQLDADKYDLQLVGDGPQLLELKRTYPHVKFLGLKKHKELAQVYQQADVFVFTSKTDTFGLVMAEAMSCGTPVAAYPVTGPQDVIDPGITGIMQEDLNQAIQSCLTLDRAQVRAQSMKYSWQNVTDQFIKELVTIK